MINLFQKYDILTYTTALTSIGENFQIHFHMVISNSCSNLYDFMTPL